MNKKELDPCIRSQLFSGDKYYTLHKLNTSRQIQKKALITTQLNNCRIPHS